MQASASFTDNQSFAEVERGYIMLAVLMIGVTEATSGTVTDERREYRQTEISRRGTGRTGDRTFPVDLSQRERRAAITTRR